MSRARLAGLTLCSASLLLLNSCEKEEPEEFGFTCVDLLQAESEEVDPFPGTTEIRLTLRYDQCLIDYYTAKHTEQRLDGTEGPETFERWRERLCSEPVADPLVACEITDLSAFQQTLQESGTTMVYQMTISYKIKDSSQIRNRTLLWGPGPLEAYAECESGQRPYVKLALPSDVIGINKEGKTIWSAESWSNPLGVMQLTSGGCIEAEIKGAP